MYTHRFMYGMQVGQKVTICIHLDSCTVCRQDRQSQYVYTQIHVRYVHVGRTESHNMHTPRFMYVRYVGRTESHNMYTPRFMYGMQVGQKVTICIHLDSCTVCMQEKKSQYVYTQIHVRYVGRTESHNMYTPRFMYGMYMQVGQKVTICIHLNSCTVCRQDRKSQYVYTQIHVRYVGRTESHNMYTPRFKYGMQVGQKVTICIHLDSCTVCRQDRKSQYVYTQIHVRYVHVGRTESHNMYTPRFMYGMQVGQKVTICIHLDSCTVCRQDRRSQYVYTQIHVRYVGRTKSHNMYTPRFMYGMQVGQKVTICIHLDSCTVCRQDRKSQYVYTQIHVRYVHVGRTESHNMYTPRFMYGMQVGQKVTICIHLDSCTVCRQDRKSQYVYTYIHVRYVGRTKSHNLYTPRFMYGMYMQVGQKVTICIHLDSCTVCRQDRKSQYVYTQIHVRYVVRTESHNMYTPRFMYGMYMQVGQKVTICIHLDSCTVCRQDRKSQYVYTQIHVRYVGRTKSHNMYTPRFKYGMQVGQKVTICIHLDSCTVCRQDRKSQYVYTQIHVRYVGRTESHNMYTPRLMYGMYMQVGQKVTICIHLDSCTVCRQDRKSQYVYTQIHVRYVGRTKSHNMYTPRFMYGMYMQVGQKVTICIHLDSCTVCTCRQDRKSQYVYTYIHVRYVGRTESHNMYTPRFMYGMQVGQKVTICIHLDSCTVCRQDRKSQYVYTQIHVLYVHVGRTESHNMYTPRFMYGMQVGQKVTICIHLDSCTYVHVGRTESHNMHTPRFMYVRYVGRTESHNMYTPRFMYGMQVGQKVTICIHLDSCTVCRQDRKSQYVYTQIHVRYVHVGRTESHNMHTPRFMYVRMQVGQKVTICIHLDSCTVCRLGLKVTICIHLDSCTVCRQDRKSQYVYTQIHVRYVHVGRTESHNMHTPRFMYGMQVGQKVTICIHLDSCTVCACRQDRKSQCVYTQIHVRYVGRTKSHNMYTPRFMYGMQVGQKVTICIHLYSCTVCRQDKKSQFVYTQIHVRYVHVGRTESHNMYTPRFMYGMQVGQKVTICIHLDSCTVCSQDRKSQYVYTQIHVRYVHVGRTESHNMYTPRFVYGMQVGQKVTICIHLDSCTVCRQDKKSQYVYTQIQVRYVGRTESHNMYTPRFMYGMQVGQKVTICIHLDSCTVCRQDRKSQYVYTQINVRYVHVGSTESHNMYTPRFVYGMQVGRKVTICIHLDSCTVCRQDKKSQYVYTYIHVRYVHVGRTESHNMYTPRFMYGMYMQVGQKVTICIHVDSCTVCRQDRKSQYVYTQIHVRYVGRTESHNMYTPRFMYGMQVGQKVTICIHLDSCTVCRQDRKSQYVYTQIHVRYVHVGRTESHNMYTPRFMYGMQVGQKVTICIHLDSCTVCRQDRKSQYVYTYIHVRYVGRTKSHNLYTPRFMYGMYMQVGQKVTICIHLDSCTVCRQDRKSQYVYTQIHVRYVVRTESHNMYTPRFMYGMYMQVGQKVTICIHLDSCTVCRQDRKSQYVYTQIHVRYVGRTKSHNMYTHRFKYGMQVGQKVTICIHLDSCTVCRQDRKSQYVYTQIHVRYVGRTESHNMYTPRLMYGMYMQVGQKVTICIHLDSCTVCRQDRKSQYVYTQIHVRYVGRTKSHNMYTPRFMYGMYMQVGQKVTICIHLDSCTVCTCRQDRKSQYVYTQIHVRYVGRTESHNMYTPRFMYGMQVGQKVTICIHLDSCTVCRQDRKSQYVYTQIHVRYVGRTESHNMYTPRFMYGMCMQVGQKVTICIHLDSCTVCRQDKKSQYVYTQIHVRYVGRTESHNMYTPIFMYGMQVGQKVTICIHLDSCTVCTCRQDRKSQYVYTQIHVRYVGRTESHNMYTPRFMYGMQLGQKVTICIHLDSCTVCTCRQDRKSQYVYTQIRVRYVGRTESHNMYTPRFMYGMQVGQKVTICIHIDSSTVCRQDRKSQYVYTQIHVRYVGRTESHNMYTPRFMYGMQVGQKVTICIHLDSCTVCTCRQDRKSQYVYTQIRVRYVGRTESHNMYTPRFMYGMQVGQKVTICIHLDSCTVCTCRQDRKSQYVYTQIHVRYVHVGRTESHNMYTRRFMYGMQVGQKVTICIHLDSCTVCRQDRKSQYVYTQIHVRYVGRTESHNMYTPRFMYCMYMQVGQKVTICIHLDSCTVCRQDRKSQYVYTQIHVRMYMQVGQKVTICIHLDSCMYGMQVGQKVTICIHLDSCTVCRQDRKSQYVYTQIHVRYVGRTESHNMYTPRFMYGMYMQVGQKVTICIHLDSCMYVCRQDRKSQYAYTQIHVRYVGQD